MSAKKINMETSNAAGCVFTLVMIAAAVWLLTETGANVPLSIIVFLLLVLLIYTFKEPGARRLKQIDEMSGEEFEHLVARLLKGQGYQAELTKSSGDLGVDVVARHGQDRLAVQVKRQEKPISRRAVSDAVAGMPAYECSAAMVVTNNYFTDGAKSLADMHGCELIDRDTLSHWIGRQSGPSMWRILLLILFTLALIILILDTWHGHPARGPGRHALARTSHTFS